jgi:transcriptional regulator with XRE-family HTH domain
MMAMRPPQLKKLLKDAGLTQTEAAELIGVTARQMRRYVSGDTPVLKVVELALRHVVDQRRKEPK